MICRAVRFLIDAAYVLRLDRVYERIVDRWFP